jgi:1-acyl-sn-glycerol-3-phosphate acyltransferase
MTFLAKLVRSLWVWGVTSLLILLTLPVMALVRAFDRDPLSRRTARLLRGLGRTIVRAQLPKLRVSGLERLVPGKAYLIVCNHQSFIDVVLVTFLPVDAKFLGKEVLFQLPVVGWMMKMAQDVPVSRKDPRKAARALLQCAKLLRAGCSVLMFPEGTRSLDGSLLPFSDAPFQIAIREGVAVLPVAVDGTGKYLPRDQFFVDCGVPVALSVLSPVEADGWNVKEAVGLRDLVHSRIAEELRRLRLRAA